MQMIALCPLQIWFSLAPTTNYENKALEYRPLKCVEKICSVVNNSAADCTILLKFGTWMWVPQGCRIVKIHFVQMQDGRRRPDCTYLSRDNSTAYCLILLKSGTWVNSEDANWLKFIYHEI